MACEEFKSIRFGTERLDGITRANQMGDHDPSGEDMVRDVEERLQLFGVRDIEVQKLALTMEQVRQYNPPPNPAKMSDSRAEAYVVQHGRSSWEVDALPPNVLAQIIRKAFRSVINQSVMDRVISRETKQRLEMQRLACEARERFEEEEG